MHTLRRLAMLILISALALTACQPSAEPPPAATDAPPISEEIEEPATAVPEAADEPTAEAAPPDTPPPAPTETPPPTPTEDAQPEPTETAAEDPIEDTAESAEAIEEQETTPEETPDPEVQATAATPSVVAPAPPTTQPAVATSALIVRDDETPAPPLIVSVSSNREFPGYNHVLIGTVQNGGDENYAGLRLIGTFFRADGSRHGPISVNLQCPVLAPGDLCPFRIDATDKGLTQVMLHPEGYPTTRTTAEVSVANVRTWVDSIGYVHITGLVTNPNPAPVWDVTLNAALLDAAGAMVSLGTDVLVGALEPGATETFEVLVRHQPYAGYQLFVTAEPR